MNDSLAANSPRFGRLAPKAVSGSGLVETLVGGAIATLGITGLCVANANCLSIARSHREVLIVNQCLQQRAEQYRAANWRQVTDPNSALALSQNPPASANYSALQDQSETITITPYPAVTPPTVIPLVITRDATGVSTIVSQPDLTFNLRASAAVRIDFLESWTSAQGRRPRTRSTTTVIALGGLLH